LRRDRAELVVLDIRHTRAHLLSMSVTIAVRNVPDAVYRSLEARAAEEGVSLSDFVLEELRRVVERPSRGETLARIAAREPVALPSSAARLVRAARDSR
jgi:plasmid stability protein